MKTSELIKKLQDELQAQGDKELIIAANRHSYKDVKVVSDADKTTLALFDKVAE